MIRRPLALVLLLPALAHAEGAPRYNDPPPMVRRSPLAARLEELAQRVARFEGRDVPAVDPRIELACAALLPLLPDDGGPPDNALVEEALRLQGVVEPSPHLVIAGAAEGGEESLFDELSARLPAVLKQGRYRRMGVGVAPDPSPGRLRILLAFQESFVELQPVPRQIPAGGAAVLEGQLVAPYQSPSVLVTHPDGAVTRAAVEVDGARFRAAARCGAAPGRYQVEINAIDRFGPSVLANFPIYCGVSAPSRLAAFSAPPERPWVDVADAEAQLFALLNQDRARAGLPLLAADERLAAIARAHSEDMRAHGFVGHVSPTTGSADDRLRRAGYPATLVLENVGRAWSPGEAERGLMDSPGHRANIVSTAVERVGVGAAISVGARGERELLVTQLFAHVPRPFDALRTPAELRRRLDTIRRGAARAPFTEDRALDEVALEVARGIVAGRLAPEQPGAPVQAALPKLSDRYRSLRTVVIPRASEVDQIGPTPTLTDGRVTHAGVAAVPLGRSKDGDPPGFCLVLILGVHR